MGGADVGLGNVGNAKFKGGAVLVASRFGRCGVWKLGRSKFGIWALSVDLGAGLADLAIWKLENWALWGQALRGLGAQELGGSAAWRLWGLEGLGTCGLGMLGDLRARRL